MTEPIETVIERLESIPAKIYGDVFWVEVNATDLTRLIAAHRGVMEALAFASCAIKSGEPWSEDCEKIITRALTSYRKDGG